MSSIRRIAVVVAFPQKHLICKLAKKSLSTTAFKAPEIIINKVSAKGAAVAADPKIQKESCGTTTPDDELEELEEMFIMGPAGIEWNGPTRGGARPEPTRYKDWERKGRCTDF